MKRNSRSLIILLTLSLLINATILVRELFFSADPAEQTAAECRIYPENVCSADFPASLRDLSPRFTAYSLRGEQMHYIDFFLKGTIQGSIEKKYGREVSHEIVRNIQTLVYFLLDYQIRFGTRDRITLFYRDSDEKILYLRLWSRFHNALFEVFLHEEGGVETYVTAGGAILPPCIQNGPFGDTCPGVRLEKKQETLIPVFLLERNGEVRFPFDAWVIAITDFSRTGGAVQMTFPDKGLVGFFDYLGTVNPGIKVGKRYKAGTLVGTGGFAKREGADGVRYYLERRDGTPVSPFSFHHTTTMLMDKGQQINLTLTQHFYRNWHRQGLEFEKQYY